MRGLKTNGRIPSQPLAGVIPECQSVEENPAASGEGRERVPPTAATVPRAIEPFRQIVGNQIKSKRRPPRRRDD